MKKLLILFIPKSPLEITNDDWRIDLYRSDTANIGDFWNFLKSFHFYKENCDLRAETFSS